MNKSLQGLPELEWASIFQKLQCTQVEVRSPLELGRLRCCFIKAALFQVACGMLTQ